MKIPRYKKSRRKWRSTTAAILDILLFISTPIFLHCPWKTFSCISLVCSVLCVYYFFIHNITLLLLLTDNDDDGGASSSTFISKTSTTIVCDFILLTYYQNFWYVLHNYFCSRAKLRWRKSNINNDDDEQK